MVAFSFALIVLGVGGAIFGFPRFRAMERIFFTLAMFSIVAMGAVGVARARGYLTDANLYITLNVALPVLFCGLLYQIHLRGKAGKVAQ